MLFVVLAITLLVSGSALMVVTWVGFMVMHCCYGGAGTFQRPLLGDRSPGMLDIVVVSVGLLCLAVYVITGAALVMRRFCG